MTNAIQYNSQNAQLIYNSNDTEGTQWTAKEGATVGSDKNYGIVESSSYDQDSNSYTVTTSKGTLTFAAGSPYLAEARAEIPETRNFSEFETSKGGINWLELAAVVLDAEKLRRKTNREVRLVSRDQAFGQAMAAAKKIRDAADKARTMGHISAGITIGGGAVSMVGGLGPLSYIQKPAKIKTGKAKFESDLSTATEQMAKNNSKLKTLRGKGKKTQKDLDEIKELETSNVKQQKKLDKLDAKLDSDIGTARKTKVSKKRKMEAAKKDLEAAQDAYASNRQQLRSLKKNSKLKKTDPDQYNSTLKKLEANEIKLDKAVAKTQAKFDKRAEKFEAASNGLDELTAMKSKSQRLRKGETAADIKEAGTWRTKSRDKYGEVQHEAQEVMSKVQAWSATLNSFQGMTGGTAQIFQTEGTYTQQVAQSKAQEHDANAANANYEQEQANADFQEANRAIQAFQQAWEKFIDSVKATQDRLVQA